MSAVFGEKAFGGPGNQHPISANNNAIAVAPHTGGKRSRGGKKSVLVPLALTAMNHLVYKRLRGQSRGKSNRRRTNSRKRGGKGVLTGLAVPASLVAINHLYANRNKSQNNKDRGSRRRRFSRSR